MMFLSLVSSLCYAYMLAVVQPAYVASSTVIIASPAATIVGNSGNVQTFKGIPFAQQPVGYLRLRKPLALTEPLGKITATQSGRACLQHDGTDVLASSIIPQSVIDALQDNPVVQAAQDSAEACLFVDVYRPASATAISKLPVVINSLSLIHQPKDWHCHFIRSSRLLSQPRAMHRLRFLLHVHLTSTRDLSCATTFRKRSNAENNKLQSCSAEQTPSSFSHIRNTLF